jgi:alpha-beta hydrolase superfamily lysophospholipase
MQKHRVKFDKMITISEKWIDNAGTKIYTKTWTPTNSIIATLVYCHGLGEHSSRAHDMLVVFAENGIKVVGFDQRGFGNTVRMNGIHGYNDGIESTFSDITMISKMTEIQCVPHFIMGHSMGGCIALLYAHKYPKRFKGVLCSAPLIKTGISTRPSWIESFLLKNFFSRFLASFSIPKRRDLSDFVTRDKQEAEKKRQDPLVHQWSSFGLCIRF